MDSSTPTTPTTPTTSGAAFLSGIPRAAASVGGAFLASGTHALATLRPARKPLHPDGDVFTGRIYRSGSDERTGVAWVDEPGEDDVVVRVSRAMGLPHTLPDIHGLAIRIPGGGDESGAGDILFATTGWGRITRFVLTFSRNPHGRPLTTLLPYETDSGPILLSADAAIGAETYDLSWARPAGEWHSFGVLRLSSRHGDDPDLSFDPVRRQIPGLRQYPAISRLREPAYLRARRSRPDGTNTQSSTAPTQKEIQRVQ